MVFAPETPAGRFLHRALVELPGKALAHISRGDVVVSVALVAALAGVFWLIDEELALVLSMMAPEALVYLTMFEIGTLVDAIAGIALVTTTVRFQQLGAILRSMRPRARATRARRAQRLTPANDDEEGAAYLLRAA
ncbi:MAG: hypothetical protein V4808_04195 [Pseudomonadota bacterium]